MFLICDYSQQHFLNLYKSQYFHNMHRLCFLFVLATSLSGLEAHPAPKEPSAIECHNSNVTYKGLQTDQVESFVGIRYAHDTGGVNRFKPPIPYIPRPNSVIQATKTGPACPQPTYLDPDSVFGLFGPGTVPTDISEDCLRLNVWRPKGTREGDDLPVLLFIHGGIWALHESISHTRFCADSVRL